MSKGAEILQEKKKRPAEGKNVVPRNEAKKIDKELDLALNLTYRVLFEGAYSSVIPYALIETELSSKQKNYVSAISLGVIENYLYLDFLLSRLVSRSMKKKIKVLLLLALYEIEYMKENAAHITVNRYVEFAKAHFPHVSGFINAVLRNHLRQDGPELDMTKLEDAALLYSHPLEIAQLWEKAYGREETIAIMKANSQKPKVCLRVNTKLMGREELIRLLEEEGLECHPSEHTERAIIVENFGETSIEELEAYYRGLFYVQDLSSIEFLDSLDFKGVERALDLCAAPGGKSLYMAEEGLPFILSCDINLNKLGLIEKNARRLKFRPYVRAASPAEAMDLLKKEREEALLVSLLNDAAVYREEFEEGFDLVLCDVPCSGLGVIRKKPEIKYRKEMKSLGPMLELQARILENAAHYVRGSGLLIYATCTTNPAENEERVREFLACRGGSSFVLEKERGTHSSNSYSDGFYYAVLRKQGI